MKTVNPYLYIAAQPHSRTAAQPHSLNRPLTAKKSRNVALSIGNGAFSIGNGAFLADNGAFLADNEALSSSNGSFPKYFAPVSVDNEALEAKTFHFLSIMEHYRLETFHFQSITERNRSKLHILARNEALSVDNGAFPAANGATFLPKQAFSTQNTHRFTQTFSSFKL